MNAEEPDASCLCCDVSRAVGDFQPDRIRTAGQRRRIPGSEDAVRDRRRRGFQERPGRWIRADAVVDGVIRDAWGIPGSACYIDSTSTLEHLVVIW